MDDLRPILEKVALDGGAEALDQVGLGDEEAMLELANAAGVDYARDRAAELVGKRVEDDGTVVDNPRADYSIDDATRELIRADVSTALEQGWSNDQLAEAIGKNYAFSDDRAETIARTETAFADVAGNLAAYEASGQVEGKQWITGGACCDECAELDGVVVALDDDFPGDGGDGPPLHPNCRCDVVPILTEESEE